MTRTQPDPNTHQPRYLIVFHGQPILTKRSLVVDTMLQRHLVKTAMALLWKWDKLPPAGVDNPVLFCRIPCDLTGHLQNQTPAHLFEKSTFPPQMRQQYRELAGATCFRVSKIDSASNKAKFI